MDKKSLRKRYRDKRAALDDKTIDQWSMDIANRCLKLPIWDKTNYHIFLSIRSKKEVDTTYLLHILQGRDKTIAVPKTQFEDASMQAILLQENTKLSLTPYGIPEPEAGIELPESSLDVVFVPLLAYDGQGNRLGYGKGFYDRFLSKCRTDCLFIGLSFFPPEEEIPSTQKDIPLDFCVTPHSIYEF